MTSSSRTNSERAFGGSDRNRAFCLSFLALFLASTAVAEEEPVRQKTQVVLFYQNGCPHSRRVRRFLDQRVEPIYPTEIKKYEIHQPENAQLFSRLIKLYGQEAADARKNGVPALFIADRSFQGDKRATMRLVEQCLRNLRARPEMPGPLERLRTQEQERASAQADTRPKTRPSEDWDAPLGESLTLPAVIGAAAVDAINPCACAVLTILLGSILAVSRVNKGRRVLTTGMAFTTAVFLCYLLMGFGLVSAIDVWAIEDAVYVLAAAVAIIVGLWNLKDGLWYGKGAKIEVPESWRPKMKKMTGAVVSAPGAFFVGIAVSFFLLPCTSGPYIVIIGMLGKSATRMTAVLLLVLYNFIFIVPFIIITLLVALGLARPYKLEQWRQANIQRFHLITGAFMLMLGLVLSVLIYLGMV